MIKIMQKYGVLEKGIIMTYKDIKNKIDLYEEAKDYIKASSINSAVNSGVSFTVTSEQDKERKRKTKILQFILDELDKNEKALTERDWN